MNNLSPFNNQLNQPEQWLRILGKGMITIPSAWREELNLKPGKLIKAKKSGRRVILESSEENAPYRIYTDSEIKQFLKEDRLNTRLTRVSNSR